MSDIEALVYMLQLADDCKHANKEFIACRNDALVAKPELWNHYGFMHDEFHDLYTLTLQIVDEPNELDRINAYYDDIINNV